MTEQSSQQLVNDKFYKICYPSSSDTVLENNSCSGQWTKACCCGPHLQICMIFGNQCVGLHVFDCNHSVLCWGGGGGGLPFSLLLFISDIALPIVDILVVL